MTEADRRQVEMIREYLRTYVPDEIERVTYQFVPRQKQRSHGWYKHGKTRPVLEQAS